MSVWLTRGTGSKVLKGSQVTSIDSKASTKFDRNVCNFHHFGYQKVQQFNTFAVFHPTCGRNISVCTPYLQLSITSVNPRDSQLTHNWHLVKCLNQGLPCAKALHQNGPSLSRKPYSISPHVWEKRGVLYPIYLCVKHPIKKKRLKSREDMASKEAMLGCRSGNPGLGMKHCRWAGHLEIFHIKKLSCPELIHRIYCAKTSILSPSTNC